LLLIGLSANNAILILEFARERIIQEHIPPCQAAEKACRPATVRCRRADVDGTTVFGRMVLASFTGVLLVPALFAIFEIATERAHAPNPAG